MAISASESERYDRQIRLWGAEAQSRLVKARVLMAGMAGLHAEAAKNLVLAGLSVTVLDHRRVSALDLEYNFLLTASDEGQLVRYFLLLG